MTPQETTNEIGRLTRALDGSKAARKALHSDVVALRGVLVEASDLLRRGLLRDASKLIDDEIAYQQMKTDERKAASCRK